MKINNFVLRISATSRCNLNCFYCGKRKDTSKEMLSDKELLEIIGAAVKAGVRKISWTGGEPTIRDNFLDIVTQAKKMGIKYQTVTTNGVTLYKVIGKLKKAGIDRYNISLDTLNEKKYKNITQSYQLKNVLKSIDSAVSLYDNTKINCVVTKENFNEVDDFVNFCEKYKGKLIVRFLELVPCGEAFGHDPSLFKREFIPVKKVIEKLAKHGKLINYKYSGNVPKSKYFTIKGLNGIYGINPNESANYHCDGRDCVKIRVSPNGWVSNCTIQLKYAHNLKGLPIPEKNKVLQEIVKEKENRNFEGFEHRQKYYNFWRFGIMPDELNIDIDLKNREK